LWRIYRNYSVIFEACRNKDSVIVQGNEIGPQECATTTPNEFEQIFSADLLQAALDGQQTRRDWIIRNW
jgi:hypothetical protein